MDFQITPNQCFCSFGDGIIYEFVSCPITILPNCCDYCAFSVKTGIDAALVRCLYASCHNFMRNDNRRGYWIVSKSTTINEFQILLNKK